MSELVTVLFADLCDSTALYETMGDRRAQKAIMAALMQMVAIVEGGQGKPLKMLGDGIMAVFDTPELACQAACQMQEELGAYFKAGSMRTGLRIGINCDQVVLTNDDVYGDAVNVAARIAARANTNQILATQATVDQLPVLWRVRVRPVEKLFVKGKRERVEVCEVIWRQDGLTVANFSLHPSTQIMPTLEIQLGEERKWVERDRPVLTIGREPENDLPLQRELVSRYHARIEFRPYQFWLVDRSTNGTYVHYQSGDRPPQLVRWKEVVLEGRGWLGLGQTLPADSPDAIQFGFGGL